jgi:hypothetical protein
MKKPMKKELSREEALTTIKERIEELSKAIRAEVNVRRQKMLQETLKSNEVMYTLIDKGLV